MFRGDHPEVDRVIGRSIAAARDLGHPRTGSEHLLLASTTAGDVAELLARHGLTRDAVLVAVREAAPMGAGFAADRETLAPLGIDVAALVGPAGPAALDRMIRREPLLPWGSARARRRCARFEPPLGLDAQAAYEASLRLALARREGEHRVEHLVLTLLALDPGAAWVMRRLGVDAREPLDALRDAFPPPHRNALLRADRRWGARSRSAEIVRRYQRTTGRSVSGGVLAYL
ncbi:Clp protease N-terminal domain-containing protein [Hamadaea tsunoensis]|uniref:Clp protease N-terminal domain-containing protein n=1 Tax=Hamadaea tsunoensis TaxID=53368 RepID=UPI00040084AE|nr:Clp protease N-terminal domain-containing protein [Hamadaea tsunoensis]